jgi:hypothetical protein
MEPTFFVNIVESPPPADLLDGRTEGRMIQEFLRLAEIPCFYNLAVDRENLQEALNKRVHQAIDVLQLLPIVHVSAHGNDKGIQLTEQRKAGEIVEWRELTILLAGITARVGQFGLCMSSCGGAHGREMANVLFPAEVPFLWLAGSASNVSYCDAALAFAVFYRGLQKGTSQNDLVQVTRTATGLTDFNIEFGHILHQQYSRERVRKLFQKIAEYSRRRDHQQAD